eukprot:14353952-Ditylum_brightwellii.AAC.1
MSFLGWDTNPPPSLLQSSDQISMEAINSSFQTQSVDNIPIATRPKLKKPATPTASKSAPPH